jgi:hypothetical protein
MGEYAPASVVLIVIIIVSVIIIIIGSSSSSSSSKFLLGTAETLSLSMSATQEKTDPLLETFHLLILFAGTVMYFEPKLFVLIIFNSGSFFSLQY